MRCMRSTSSETTRERQRNESKGEKGIRRAMLRAPPPPFSSRNHQRKRPHAQQRLSATRHLGADRAGRIKEKNVPSKSDPCHAMPGSIPRTSFPHSVSASFIFCLIPFSLRQCPPTHSIVFGCLTSASTSLSPLSLGLSFSSCLYRYFESRHLFCCPSSQAAARYHQSLR